MEQALDSEVVKILEAAKKEIELNPVEYFIGTHTYDNKVLSYCLAKQNGSNIEVVLANFRKDKKEFDKEVANLAKYFKAKIIKNN